MTDVQALSGLASCKLCGANLALVGSRHRCVPLTVAAPDVAERVRLRIVETIKLLQSLPRLGHGGRKEGTCELGVPGLPYLIVYRIDMGDDDEIVILGIAFTVHRHHHHHPRGW